MVNGRLVEQKKRTKTEEAKGNYVQIQMIAAMAAIFQYCEICRQVWETGDCEEEWLSNRLKLVPKKGDLKILDNWRGIMLIESPSKILSAIMANRIQEQILEPEGLEEQNGFMRQRGCCDGIFTVKMALQKRHEHGLSTWAVFIDLVKAFDSVPREGLFSVLEKFGIPPKMLRLIIRFHSDLIVKVNIGDKDVGFDSTTGHGETGMYHGSFAIHDLQSISRQQMKFYQLSSLFHQLSRLKQSKILFSLVEKLLKVQQL